VGAILEYAGEWAEHPRVRSDEDFDNRRKSDRHPGVMVIAKSARAAPALLRGNAGIEHVDPPPYLHSRGALPSEWRNATPTLPQQTPCI
jgi:hypothetical protein